MNKFITVIMLAFVVALTGCSREVVGPTELGKVLNRTGYSPELLPPGSVVNIWIFQKKKLITLDLAVDRKSVPVQAIVGGSEVFSATLDYRLGIDRKRKDAINNMFTQISLPIGTTKITLDMVYNVYGKMMGDGAFKEAVSDYKIEHLGDNLVGIKASTFKTITEMSKETPLFVGDVNLKSITLPSVVTDRSKKAIDNRMAKANEAEALDLRLEQIKARETGDAADLERRNNYADSLKVTLQKEAEAKVAGWAVESEGLTPEIQFLMDQEVRMEHARKGGSTLIPYQTLENAIIMK